VKTRVDDQFRREARVYLLRFTCETCAAFDPNGGTCAYGFPTTPHRAVPLDGTSEVLFCKTFELA